MANKTRVVFCMVIWGLISNCGQQKKVAGNRQHDSNGNEPAQSEDAPSDQLIIWRKPGANDQQVRDWIRKVENTGRRRGRVDINLVCGSCDRSLMLLTGPGIANFIQGDVASGRVVSDKSAPTTGGEDGPVYFCRNFRVRGKKPDRSISSPAPLSPVVYPGKPVKVAILDTGLEPQKFNDYLYNSSNRSCIDGGNAGWNLIANNRNYSDDDPIKHGTTVARFIVNEVIKYRENPVEILPVKTHDKDGASNLFNILCAFAYAKERGVQIINCSFGFFTPRRKLSPEDDPDDPNVLLLRKYVKHYLTDNKILLVAAAGNNDEENVRKTFKDYGWPYRPKDPRNLDQVCFYPASLSRSRDYPNVIAVTTVNVNNGNGTVSPDQNFSPNVVDIGVIADKVLRRGQNVSYVFDNPLYAGNETVEGSSFATPIVTGKLCANYDKIKEVINSNTYTKEDIWRKLGSDMVRNNPTLRDKIKDGRIMRK